MIKLLPLEKLLLETDSPALSFEPGKMNQPKNLRISAEIIAKIKKVDVDTVIKQTTLNAFKLFPRNVSISLDFSKSSKPWILEIETIKD